MRTTIVFLALVFMVARTVYERATTVGVFRTPYKVNGAGEVTFIPDTINAEDLHLDLESGLIFAAANDEDFTRHKWFPPLSRFSEPAAATQAGGGLRVIDPKVGRTTQAHAHVQTLTSKRLRLDGFVGPFGTHGIDIVRDPGQPEAIYIHAVNHRPLPAYAASLDATLEVKADSVVEIFKHTIGSDVATHVRTVKHDLITMPNDIFSTGPYSFYTTNDHHYRDGLLRTLEVLGTKRLCSWTDVVYAEAEPDMDGEMGVIAKVAIDHLHTTNGLGHTPNSSVLLITDAPGGESMTAAIDPETHKLSIVDSFTIDHTIDNPSWFQDPFPEVGHDASGVVNAGLQKGINLEHELAEGPIASAVFLTNHLTGPAGPNTTLLFADDDGKTLRSASAAVLVAIDPAVNDGRKQAWLFASGFASKAVVAVKVDL